MTYQRQKAYEKMLSKLVGKIDPLEAYNLTSVYVDQGMRVMMNGREKVAEELYDAKLKVYYWNFLI